MNKYLEYSKERFPIPGVLLYAGSLFYVSYHFSKVLEPQSVFSWRSLLGLCVLFLVFLHLRIFDEHKDFERDRIAYPDRLLSKGVITLRELRNILYVALAIEVILSSLFGFHILLLLLLILLWSWLMFREFYVAEFLRNHLGLYLISHQIIVPFMALYAMSWRLSTWTTFDDHLTLLVLFSFILPCLTITYEIARKTWSEDREHEAADSYTRVWGRPVTVILTLVLAFLGGGGMAWLLLIRHVSIYYQVAIALFYALLLLAEIVFLYKPVRKNSKLVELAGALYMLGVFIIGAIGFA